MTIALSYLEEESEKIRKWIKKLPKEDRSMFGESGDVTNGYCTFVMWWDGSKEGWDTSDHFDEIRRNFNKFLYSIKITYGTLEFFGDDNENLFSTSF